jgi:uncharacterized membrane protein YuzA (DUF378 family)
MIRQNLYKGGTLKVLDMVAATLLVVGGLNWGLVGIAEFDLVAAIFGGLEFGETNAGSRIVYALVGLAGVYGLVRLVGERRRLASAHAAA